ncbi:MAG: gliding motility protein GldL [Bacteroidaceae bacterium]|nr:gliding motility protein GldL [Bacteroidaceae bacterium]
MDSPKGRTYTNYLYSWGAAIVILGTLFKLTHIEGADIMLFVGMGTEVIVFFFSAFERPFDLAEDDRKEERAIRAAERAEYLANNPVIVNGPKIVGGVPESSGDTGFSGPIIINGGGGGGIINSAPSATADAELVEEMDKATKEYVEKVRALNDAIQRISSQTEALGRNMEEMDTLARNITGINALYEIQLRSAGNQVGSINLVNEETKKMAEQIKELNAMYSRMLEAMTINMSNKQL